MTLIDLLQSPWAIEPAKLLEIQAVYATHLRGEKIDLEALEAKLGRPLSNDQQAYEVRPGGVAVLSISGVIAPKANLFTKISGGASADMLTKQIDSMLADPRVSSVVLDFDTPGGSVFGIPAMGQAIRALAAEKPTVSVSTGMMASAGYWTGSAANAVYASGETDIIGSIGVVATHNYSPRGGQNVTTEITAGKFKRMASDNAPLTREGKAYLQSQVDHLYAVFVDAVAANRKVSADQVLQHMADGRIFIGQQALDAGLIDGFATVDQMVERLATDPSKFAARRKAVFAVGGTTGVEAVASSDDAQRFEQEAKAGAPEPTATDEPVLPVASETNPYEANMTPQELADKFKAENPEAHALIVAAGACAERDRIKAVREQALPGHEALIEQLAMDGKTSGAEAAIQVLAAERAKVAAFGSARANDAPAPVLQQPAPETEPKAANVGANGQLSPGVDAAALDAAAKAYQAQNPGTTYVAAIKAVQQGA